MKALQIGKLVITFPKSSFVQDTHSKYDVVRNAPPSCRGPRHVQPPGPRKEGRNTRDAPRRDRFMQALLTPRWKDWGRREMWAEGDFSNCRKHYHPTSWRVSEGSVPESRTAGGPPTAERGQWQCQDYGGWELWGAQSHSCWDHQCCVALLWHLQSAKPYLHEAGETKPVFLKTSVWLKFRSPVALFFSFFPSRLPLFPLVIVPFFCPWDIALLHARGWAVSHMTPTWSRGEERRARHRRQTLQLRQRCWGTHGQWNWPGWWYFLQKQVCGFSTDILAAALIPGFSKTLFTSLFTIIANISQYPSHKVLSCSGYLGSISIAYNRRTWNDMQSLSVFLIGKRKPSGSVEIYQVLTRKPAHQLSLYLSVFTILEAQWITAILESNLLLVC